MAPSHCDSRRAASSFSCRPASTRSATVGPQLYVLSRAAHVTSTLPRRRSASEQRLPRRARLGLSGRCSSASFQRRESSAIDWRALAHAAVLCRQPAMLSRCARSLAPSLTQPHVEARLRVTCPTRRAVRCWRGGEEGRGGWGGRGEASGGGGS